MGTSPIQEFLKEWPERSEHRVGVRLLLDNAVHRLLSCLQHEGALSVLVGSQAAVHQGLVQVEYKRGLVVTFGWQ